MFSEPLSATISYWDYRVCSKTTNGVKYLHVHEVYYGVDGRVVSWTENPVELGHYTDPGEIRNDLLLIQSALLKPVVDLDAIESGVDHIDNPGQTC